MAERTLRRREALLAGVGAVGGALADQVTPADAKRLNRRRRPVYDVVVIGAGLAGLNAATAIRRAGRSVVVLEARRRVGGRNFDHPLASGKVAELGGEWTGPGQDLVMGLAKSLGIGLFPTYADGENVYYNASGQKQTYTGDIPPASPAALAEVELAILEFNKMAASVPADAPWTAPQAGVWDHQSVQSWIDQNLHTAEAQNLAGLAIRGVYGEDADEVSLLDLLAEISGVGGDFNTSIGSAQSIRFEGGPQRMSKLLAAHLGHRVRLGVEVVGIEQRKQVTIHTVTEQFRCRRVIATIPKPLFGRLRFDPVLPPALDQLLQRQPQGSVLKVNAVYSRPFWRDAGLSGAATSEVGPIRITYDNSPPDGSPGVLVGFMEGSDSRAFFGAPTATRRAAALDCFARYFGPEALSATKYLDMMWADERFTRGAYGTYNPPGVLTSLNNPLDRPFGAVHYANSDNSPQWPGYMDGAIRSGENAATEVLTEL